MTFIRKNKQSFVNSQNSNSIVQENIIRQIKQTYDHRMMDYSMEDGEDD